MRKTISILSFLIILSCSSDKEKIEKSTDMIYLSGIIENYMFECTDANQLEVHTKAKYNPIDSTMTFYVGKSKLDFIKKWDIPLDKVHLDLDNMNSTSNLWRSLKIKGINQDSVISFIHKENSKIELTKSFNIYLFEWCDKKKQENFISALNRITELSKLK
ncbi:hypothetical protein KZY98_14235 [Croceibacter atlanticus]|uniref:hypothetical protein n=1 Tax=Croceibacter atlanticus TaxID=313588 RepID=UPI001C5F6936|nr:hypothetical protein [Croceibacter atlanticus]MBW4971620.1 hypothetical protein [Croceibacter atlanticus]